MNGTQVSASQLQLVLLGDLCLAGEVEEYLFQHPHADLWSGLSSWLPGTAVVVANLECALSRRGQPKDGKYATLRADPALARHLRRLNVAILANNHLCDYGDMAARDTVDCLRQQGIATLGYGDTYRDAVRPLVLERDGVTVGMLSYSCLSTNGENYATDSSPGVPMLSPWAVEVGIRALRPQVDAVIVFVHWGLENERQPVVDQVRLARQAIEWGADAVIGGHGHVVQPYEYYRGGFIAYGLGNFLFGDVGCSASGGEDRIVEGTVRQRAQNRESLSIHLVCRQRRSGSSVSVDAVSGLQYDLAFTPRRCDATKMTIPPVFLNREFQRHASTCRDALGHDRQLRYVSSVHPSGLRHQYYSPPISATSGLQGKLRRQMIREGAWQRRRAWVRQLPERYAPLGVLRSCVKHLIPRRPTA
jgi:Bacterial capsule synthesis protein PGA_cap